jgi:hypothetical protein
MLRNLFKNARSKDEVAQTVVVVSGLPRSGTSLMMQMLEAGGITVLTDGIREPDEDNPRGYYEFERVKALPKGDYEWLESARGKAVKVVSALLEYLPPEYNYKVIFMHRRMEEILASQRKMLIRRGKNPEATDDQTMADLFHKHLEKVQAWIQAQPNIDVLNVDYNALVADPRPHLLRIRDFLGIDIDIEKMAEVVDPGLYRNRGRTYQRSSLVHS